MTTSILKRSRVQITVLAAAVSAVCMSGAALAQDQEQDDEGRRDGLEELVVTGTRIPRNDFTTPNPVATMNREDIDALGLVSVGDILGQITSNVYSASLDTVGDGAFFVGATIANLRGMNTGFGTRTLTLVNGRRMPPTTNGGAVDLAMIPSVLVGRVETATGGNGATYGTDAMAGVVNIIIDNRFEGTRVDAGFYQTHAGDGNQYSFSLANGTKFLNENRGHIVIGYEHQTVDPIRDCSTARDWCGRSFNWVDNSTAAFPPPVDLTTATELPPIPEAQQRYPGQGWPRYQVFENVRYLFSSTMGALHTDNLNPNDPYNGEFLEFTPDGRSVIPYNTEADGLTGPFREAAYNTAYNRVVGGEGALLTEGYTLRNGSVRNNFYARFNYDFNERLSVNAELGFNRNNGQTFQERADFNSATHCIYADNPFLDDLDATARQVMLERQGNCTINQTVFLSSPGTQLRKSWRDQVDRGVKTETEMLRFVIGANGGMFGSDRWNWDTYFQYGETDRYQLLYNNQTRFRYDMAEDPYRDPNTGEIVCRVNATDAVGEARRNSWRNFFVGNAFTGGQQAGADDAAARVDSLRAGCVPLNPFGHAASPEALAYAYDDLIEFTYSTQRVLSGTVSGTLFDGIGAGPARIATGIDWREDLTENDVGGDPDVWIRTDFGAQYGDPWTGGTEVSDIFTEFDMPLLRDKPGAQYMMMNLAVRRSRNSTFREDPVEPLDVDRYSKTWKTSFVWDPTSWLRLRSTRSADIRSPAPRELFYRQTFQGGGYFNFSQNPWRNPCPAGVIEGPGSNCSGLNGDTWDTLIGANPNLENEESRTETIGFVLTPGGIASGLEFAVDYVDTYIKGGISYATGSDPENEDNLNYTIFRCFEYDDPYYCDLIEFGPPTLEEPNNPRSDIVSLTTTQENTEPFWTKAFDISVSYRKQLSRGGSYNIRLLATHTREQNICTDTTRTSPTETICNARQNVVGQTGGLFTGGGIFSNYTATPDWSANLYGTYRKGPFSLTAQARYVGPGQISAGWVGPDDPRYGPELYATMSVNTLPSWTTWNSTFSYDFSRSRFSPDRFNAMSLQLVVDNLFDKQPGFFSGGGIGGINTRYFSGMGRSYRLRLNMEF